MLVFLYLKILEGISYSFFLHWVTSKDIEKDSSIGKKLFISSNTQFHEWSFI